MYESISLMANEVDLRNLLQAGRNLRGFDTHTSAILESVQLLFSQVEKNIAAVIGLHGQAFVIPEEILQLRP